MRAAFFILGAVVWGQSEELIRKSEAAKRFMSEGRFAEAIPIYQELVRAVPGNPGVLLNLALAEHMAGRNRESVPHFQAVLKSEPGNFPALFSLGAAYLQMHEPALALDPLRRAVRAEPTNMDARGLLAGALLATGGCEEAAAQYRELTKLAPEDPRAWFGLGRSYEEMASQAFERLSRAAPQSPYEAALLGESRLQRRQYRSAFFFFSQALEKSTIPGLHAGIAEVYRRTDHADWASQEEQREKALKVDCTAHRAACQFAAGKFADALAGGSTPESLYWRSKAANELARAAYAELGKLPDSPQIHVVKANILRHQGQPLEAAKEWRAALELQPGNAEFEEELAVDLHAGADYEHALAIVEKLLAANPGSAQLNWLAGDSLLRMEQAERAIAYLETSVRLDPKPMPAQASLG
ncbi:MAG: tetratricopeptide repeat protein, partial [Acidobacteriaceae bacterium]|nr:tetratricopeptide repeat protein [Acidobacteriaceae bacterium]